MVAGDVVNTAARLQSNAPVNGILVGETTWRATRDAIDYREAEPVQAKGKSEPVDAWEAVEARGRVGVDISGRRADAARRPPPRARHAARRVRARAKRALRPARDARRRAGHRQEPARLRALPGGRAGPRARLLAAGPLTPLRRGHQLLGARRDGEGARRHPRDGHGGRGRAEAPATSSRRRSRADDVEWTLAHLRPLAGIEDHGRTERKPGRGVHRLARLPRGDRRRQHARARLRGSPLGGRWAPRLRRPPRRLGDARPAARRRYRTPRATRASSGLGRWQDERPHAFARPAVDATRRPSSCTPCSSAPRSPPMSRQRSSSAPAATRCMRRSSCASSTSAPRARALPETVQGIIAARLDVLDREEKELLQDAAVLGRVFWVGGLGHDREAAEAALAPARATRVRPARAPEHRRGRDGVRVPPRARPRGRVRADPACAARREAPPRRRLARDARPVRRPRRAARASLPRRARILGAGRRARRAGGPRAHRGRRPRARAQRVRDRGQLLPARCRPRRPRTSAASVLFGLGSALEALADPEAKELLAEASATLAAAGDPETAAEAETLARADRLDHRRRRRRRSSTRAEPSSSCAGDLRPPRTQERSGRPPGSRCSTLAGARPSRRERRRSGWPPSSGSTRSAPMPSRQSARRATTSATGVATPTSSSPSSLRRRRTHPWHSHARSITSPARYTCHRPATGIRAQSSQNYETMRRYGHVSQIVVGPWPAGRHSVRRSGAGTRRSSTPRL